MDWKEFIKGIFKETPVEDALALLESLGADYRNVYESLKRHFVGSWAPLHQINIESVRNDIESEKVENDDLPSGNEGAIRYYYGKRYERDPQNRKRAIEIHGLSCVVCGFNYEQRYGERGKDFVEVHHTKPLSSFGGEVQQVNPETDLVPVCSNCHRMIHRRHDDVLTVEQLKARLQHGGC